MPAKPTFGKVEQELRKRTFGVLGTVTKDGRAHTVGVVYAVSPPQMPLRIYITTRNILKKTRNIHKNRNVSFVVPLLRRVLQFVPPACIEFQGTAEIVAADHEEAVQAFGSSYFLKSILSTERNIVAKAGGEMCFIRITPDAVVFTYALGVSLLELRKNPETAFARVLVPASRRPA